MSIEPPDRANQAPCPPHKVTTERLISLIRMAELSHEDVDRMNLVHLEGPGLFPLWFDKGVRWTLILPYGSGEVTKGMWQEVLKTMEKEDV